MKQILIAIDQLVNTLFAGFADETLSARCYRLQDQYKFWSCFRVFVDTLFFWQDNHCYHSWLAEFNRKQYPTVYSDITTKEAEIW